MPGLEVHLCSTDLCTLYARYLGMVRKDVKPLEQAAVM